MTIELWTARLERPLNEQEGDRLMFLLPAARRERLLRLEPRKRREPLCAYLLLRMALWECQHWRELPEIALTAFGKPYFPSCPQVHFNLSHTRGAVLVGLSSDPVGVDIERIRPISRRFMQRMGHTDGEEAFFKSWVRREARAKRSGDGIGTVMRPETPLGYGEFYYEVETFPGYAAGVATRSRAHPEEPRRFDLGTIL